MAKILKRSSFGLIRTNPRLTTNIKLVADTNDKIYLESIDADPLLSKSIYKGFELKKEGQYSYDIKRFYSQNRSTLPEDIAYKVFEYDDSLLIKDQYNQQYDFTYCAGAYSKNSLLYKEEFAIFSPIWLEKDNLPDYFVIFKMDDPVTINTNIQGADLDLINKDIEDSEKFFENYIKKAKIIKTFDLTERSNLGQYIRRHVNDSLFPESCLYSSLDKSIGFSRRGISYRNGGFTSKSSNVHYDFSIQDKTILESDDYITTGFQLDGIVVANILNLEFLFDGVEQEKYTFSRYFGLYMNAIELGKFTIDSKRLYDDRDQEFTQLPRPTDALIGVATSEKPCMQTNKNGIKIYPNIENNSIYEGKLITFEETQNSRFSYVKDTKYNFYSIDNINDWKTENDTNFIRIKNKKIDWKNFTGFESPFAYVPVKIASKPGRPGMWFRVISSITSGDEIRIQFIDWQNNEQIDSVDNHTIKADASLAPSINNGILFSPNGTSKQIAKAISSAINSIQNYTNEYSIFSAVSMNETVIVFSRIPSESWNKLKISFFSQSINFPFEISNQFVNEEEITNYRRSPISQNSEVIGKYISVNFDGGNNNPKSRVIIEKDEIQKFRDLKDDIYIKTTKGYQTTTNHGIYLDEPILDKTGKIISFNNFDKFYTINLKNNRDDIELGSSSKLGLYKLAKNSLGWLSILPIRDFDFDTFSTQYNKSGDADINKLFKWYKNENGSTATPVFDWEQIGSTAQSFLDDIVGPSSSFIINEGFSKLNGTFNEITNVNIDVINEYDKLKENYIPELALSSKVVPFINKWVYDNESVDVRENPYRLNNSIVFGYSNFSPVFDEISRNPKFYTHEWYYLQKYPPYMTLQEKIDSFSYFDEDLDIDELKSINNDYFTEYFTRETIDGLSITRDFKYSLFSSGTKIKPSETLFRGVKVEIKDRTEFSPLNFDKASKKYISSEKYNDYKFSAVLTYGEEAPDVSIIKNDKFKAVTLVVRADFKDDPQFRYNIGPTSHNFIDRSLLYSVNNKLGSTGQDSLFIADKLISGKIVDWKADEDKFIVSLGSDSNENLPSLLNELQLNKNGGYNDLKVELEYASLNLKYTFKGIRNITSNTFECSSIEGIPLYGTILPDSSNNLNLNNIKIAWGINEFLYMSPLGKNPIYIDGGYNGYLSVMDFISFGNLAYLINEGSPSIKYINIDKNGYEEFNTFCIDLIRPDYIVTSDYLQTQEIRKSPQEIQTDAAIIGYEIVAKNRVDVIEMLRNRGEYTPKFTDIFRFVDTDDLKHESLDFLNINFLTALPHIKDENIGKIKSLFFNKVNIENPRSILGDDAKNGEIYPLIDEIAIDKRDMFVFKSNWDTDYYKSYSKRNISNSIIGTREPKEQKSFFASKIISIPNNIQIEKISSGIVTKQEFIESASSINNVESAIVSEILEIEDKRQLILSVFTEKLISNWLIEDGIEKTFNKFINPEFSFEDEGIIDVMKKYIELNIIPRLFLKEISLWERSWNLQKNQISPDLIELNLTDVEKVAKGFKKIKEFQVTFEEFGSINFRLIYNLPKDRNTSISLTLSIEKK